MARGLNRFFIYLTSISLVIRLTVLTDVLSSLAIVSAETSRKAPPLILYTVYSSLILASRTLRLACVFVSIIKQR